MSLYKSFKTNPDAEVQGVDFVFNFEPEYQNADGTWPTFVVRRPGGANAKEYDQARERARRPFKEQIANKTFDDADAHIVLLNAFLDALLVGWRNVRDANDSEIAFSLPAARQYFTELPELFAEINLRLQKRSVFQDQLRESDAKNL